ncbi:DUF3530 family protein [Shewanella waksmanii]|uniref:DUF3530 family protein n=1 Tax=Shewanella waksmanii TaxID=213783 RepID=UPI00048E1ABC|nr:DUF3530 family protein [Shewanella waksmanii]
MPHLLTATLVLLSLLFSHSLSAESSRYDYLDAKEVVSLGNDDSGQALVRSWRGKHQFGAAILVADFGAHADEAGVVQYIRRHINPQGWASIAITPPAAISPANYATEASEVAKAGKKQLSEQNNKPLKKYSDEQWQKLTDTQVNQLTATLDQLDSVGAAYPGKRMLITLDRSAGVVISLLSESKLPKPDILVVINPYRFRDQENQLIPEQLAQLDIPILDIQSNDGHSASQATATQRKALAPMAAPLRYEQQYLSLNINQSASWPDVMTLIAGFGRRIDKAYP